MTWRRVAFVLLLALALAPAARSGHELPVYPSYYPHEIEIATVTPERAAPLLLDGKIHAYVGSAPHFAAAPPDIFVVLDADCSIDTPSLRNLVDAAAVSGRPSQAINLLRPNRQSSPLVQLSTFGFMLKNLVRQRGLQRLAGRVHLTGTGMAMPFPLFRASAQTRSSIVEDLALGLELAAAGHSPMLVSNARWRSRS